MLHLVPISSEHQPLLSNWLAGDVAGNKELSFYNDVSAWIKLLDPNHRWGWIVSDDKKPVGFVDLEKDFLVGHFSFYIAPEERGKGKSKELLNALIQNARNLGIKTLQAGVEGTNISSEKALESSGFVRTKKDKDDYSIYELKIND